MSAPRGIFNTRFGAIAATVGSAVGLGNIWRFPYEAGMNGGGAFLIIYLLCVLLLGVPVVIAEFVIGHSSRRSVSGAFCHLEGNHRWRIIGIMSVLAAVLILGFYSVIAGWTLDYIFQAASGGLSSLSSEGLRTSFESFSSHSYYPLLWLFALLLLNYLIISRGVEKGIERISNILMPLLFLLLIVFCLRALSLEGAADGLAFLFRPDFSKVTPLVVLRAMGQAFFSLSLGMGVLITYASYFKGGVSLPKIAIQVALLDSLVAILAGVIIFPTVFSFGVNPAQGPELVFITLPNIFNQMPGGILWSTLFFVLISVAAVTSTISLFEVITSYLHEEFSITRKKSTLVAISVVGVLGTLCSLSFGVLRHATLFGMTIFEASNFFSSNILLPLGGIFISIYLGWIMKPSLVRRELAHHGRTPWYFNGLIFIIRYVAPIAIFIIFITGLFVK